MTDSLAQIAAEQVADEALWAAHPDPLSIAGDMQARAADRCARKRALWAADHCDSCPWRGCSTCQFQGGVDPNAPVAQRDSDATRRANQGVLWDTVLTAQSGPAATGIARGPAELDWSSTP